MGSNDLLQDGKLSQKQVSVFGSIKDAQAAHKAHDDNAKPVAPCMLQRVGVASTQFLRHACCVLLLAIPNPCLTQSTICAYLQCKSLLNPLACQRGCCTCKTCCA